MNPLLEQLKAQLHISHSSEDKALTEMLDSSKLVVGRLIGYVPENDKEFNELVINRTRYAYFDQVEYFEDNFHDSIVRLSFLMPKSDEDTV